MSETQVGFVLLIGEPGVGKSLLGQALQQDDASSGTEFVNVGEQLRALRLVDAYFHNPTEARLSEMRRIAREILSDACLRLRAPGNDTRWVPLCKARCRHIKHLQTTCTQHTAAWSSVAEWHT